jgi:hypothetical protein
MGGLVMTVAIFFVWTGLIYWLGYAVAKPHPTKLPLNSEGIGILRQLDEGTLVVFTHDEE